MGPGANGRRRGRGQVEIQVEATGLNFRDVLNALGMYPGDAGPLGSEFAGRVVALGAGVETLAVGERVMGVGAGTFATSVVTDAALVVRGAGRADLGGRRRDPDRVPHRPLRPRRPRAARSRASACSSMPPPAAWASPPSRSPGGPAPRCSRPRAAPRSGRCSTSLGVEHVMDSRSLDFADEIHARTGGRGVDVVLNSLGGDFIPASLRVVSRGGRFVEIGKRGIWDATRGGRRPTGRRLSTCSTSAISSSASRPGSRRC